MTTVSGQPILCRVHIRVVPGDISSFSLTQVISHQSCPAILGGNKSVERYSIFCAEPVEIFTFEDGQNNPFEKLQSFLEKYKLEENAPRFSDSPPLPGWMGFFAYPLAHHIEKLPRLATDDLHLPLIHLAFYDKAIVYDHRTGQVFLIVLEYAGQRLDVNEKFRQLQTWLDDADVYTHADNNSNTVGADPRVCLNQNTIGWQPLRKPKADEVDGRNRMSPIHLTAFGGCHPLSEPVEATSRSPVHFTTNMTRDYYFNAVKKIKRYIVDGDVYQINFSQRFACDFTANPADYFLWQNRHNPSPLSAYLSCADWSIISASPELFLRIEGDSILTRPIKGTRPRKIGPGAEMDNRKQFEALLHSSKEQAELIMIVDLERNDLARVCVPGTRHVSRPRTIEAYPTVFHAYADIAGRLPRPNDAVLFCDILRSTFPGGSITGAPKIRAMEIIEELEPTARGIYTGCIGHIGIDFGVTLNIAIRTAVVCHQKAYIQTGGGIVADSDPQAEWEETLTKADVLLAGLTAVNVDVAEASRFGLY
jgi:para-aminobenzoate synthetase component 1